jgi:transcriptional regulator with XRE-family HTH domain
VYRIKSEGHIEMGFGINIKHLRETYNLTQNDIAAMAGVTDKAVWAWENTSKMPKMATVEKIANHFGLKKSNLIEDDGLKRLDSFSDDENEIMVLNNDDAEIIQRIKKLSPIGQKMIMDMIRNIEMMEKRK